MPEIAELTYFNGRGLGEIIRITLVACGIKFDEVHLTSREQFEQLLPELLFKQVPLLRIDGKKLIQSQAIVRYVARKGNLLGKTDEEILRVDELFMGTRDMYAVFYPAGFQSDEVVSAAIEKNLEKYCPIFDKLLAENGSGYLVGNALTIADLGLFEALLAFVEFKGVEVLKKHASLQKFYDKVSELDSMKNYLANVRKPKNSPEYVANVKVVLRM